MNHTGYNTDRPLRPLFLAPRLGLGGMTLYLVELAQTLASMGHAVRVVTVDGPGIQRHRAAVVAGGAPVSVVPNLTRRAMAEQAREHRADFIKLFTGAVPPDTRLSLRLMGTGLPIVESIHVLPERRGVRVSQQVFYRSRRASRYAAIVFTNEVETLMREKIPALAPCVHRLRRGTTTSSASSPCAGWTRGRRTWRR
jgi:hypothetical protein